MTTIAYDGKQIAADTLECCGDMRFGYRNKIHLLSGDRYVAFAGNTSYIVQMVKWLEDGINTPPPEIREGDDISGLYIDENRNAWEIDKFARLFPACIPWAGGTGERYAMACLKLGVSVRKAVEIAIELDRGSGGQVQVVDVE